MRILLVDDEVELTDPLARVLQQEGYIVDVVEDGRASLQFVAENHYDLLILDWMLPQFSGLAVCQELRSQGSTVPVLFLTAKDTVDARVIGLDAGADDYLVKPFELRELLARVRALLRRSLLGETNLNPARLKVGDLEFDRENQIAYRHQHPIELSEKEAQLLEYFMQNPGQLLTHTQIYQKLWGLTEAPNSNVLAALVRLLRRKIDPDGQTLLIHAVYGKGYRFGEKTSES